MDYFTPQNVSILVVLIAAAYSVVRVTAHKTKTTLDDDFVGFVEKNRAWVRDVATPAWLIVEQLWRTGKLPRTAKLEKYLEIIRQLFSLTHQGEKMPGALEEEAKLYAAGLSVADKLGKEAGSSPMSGQGAAK